MDEIVKRPVGRPPMRKPEDQNLPTKPKQTRNRPDLAKFGQEYVEPGDNSKYLKHALTIVNQPLVDLNDINAVTERIEWYFDHCFSHDMKPTVTGLCNSLRIARTTLLGWKNGTFRDDSYQAIVLKAYAVMEELWESYMQNGKINPVSGIFLAKNNYGYTDKQEYVLTPNTSGVSDIDPATIEAKYAELPDVDGDSE
jgi:hypothetical protein